MAAPHVCMGGAKAPFPYAVEDGIDDIAALRVEIKQADELSHDKTLPRGLQQKWRHYHDELEHLLDERVELMRMTTISHKKAVNGCATDKCREYVKHDPSRRELRTAVAARGMCACAGTM